MINRMESHDAGNVRVDGRDINTLPLRELRLRMGYAIQSVGLFPHWTVARNIGTVPALLGWPVEKISKRVDTLLQLFDLDPAEYRGRYPQQLSGGQQQRVGVARALAADPDVLLMDEPFGALDPVIRASLQREMKRIHLQSRKTIVMVTHDIDEALFLATRIVLLDHGRVLQAATPLELLTRPASEAVIDFIGRSELGLKRLSLMPARDLARQEALQPGAALLADISVREALSFMALHGVSFVNLTGAAGEHVGVLHAADIFCSTAVEAQS